MRLCVHTDSSDLLLFGIVTQLPLQDLSRPHGNQLQHPLAFPSGKFTGPQLGCSTLDKEAYAIMATTDRMHWVLATTDGFDIFTDQHNFIILLDPLDVVPI